MTIPSPNSLAWEHYVVSQVARAAVGLLSREVVGLAAEIDSDTVVLHAAVARLTDELCDDLDHVCFELDVLLDGHVTISHVESIGVERPWPPATWHPIYVAKPEHGDYDHLPAEVQ